MSVTERFTAWYLAHVVHPLRNEEGASAVEYGILVGLIAAVIVTIVTTLGTEITAAFQKVVNAIP